MNLKFLFFRSYLKFILLIIIIFFQLDLYISFDDTIAARNGEGKKVDWWFVLKLPSKVRNSEGKVIPTNCLCGEPICSSDNVLRNKLTRGSGLCYYYADSNNPSLTYYKDLNYDCLGQGNNDPLSKTLNQIIELKTSNWGFFNDDFSKTEGLNSSKYKCNEGIINAHSKGAICFNENGGFHLQSSCPNFPDPSYGNKQYVPLGCQIDDNVLFSQHFFALSLDKDQMMSLGKGLQSSHLCSANIYEKIKEKLVSENLLSMKKNSFYKALVQKDHLVQKTSVIQLQTKFSGINVTLISKNKQSTVPPWALVANILKQDISVASWLDHRDGIPSICAGDIYANTNQDFCLIDEKDNMNLTKKGEARYNVENLLVAKYSLQTDKEKKVYYWDLVAGKETGNHAKFGISTNKKKETSSLVLFSDMNMQGFPCSKECKDSQNGRGGCFFVLNNSLLWESIKNSIQKVCSCKSIKGGKQSFIDQRMCKEGCIKKMNNLEDINIPLLQGNAMTFWNISLQLENVLTIE